MASFVELSEYLTYYGITDNIDQAELDLDFACDKIRDHLCQQVDLITSDVITLYGTDTRALILPELPVVSVASVTLDGTAVTDYTVDSETGLLWRNHPGWWPRAEQYAVTYTHGWAPADIPSIFKLVAFRLARGATTNPDGVRRESVAGYSVEYDSDEAHLSVLDARRVKRVPVP